MMQSSQSIRQFLAEKWRSLLYQYNATDQFIQKKFDLIVEKYSQTNRHYHNLAHLKYMFHVIESFKSNLQNYEAVGLAIFYHDIIYNTLRDDNEQLSAEFAYRVLTQLENQEELADRVKALILLTREHQVSSSDEDEKIFLDADLAILGASWEEYCLYSGNIRKEFHWVPDFIYKPKRITRLQTFLDSQHLFFTEKMHKDLELQARKNIQSEILELRNDK